MYLWLDRWLRRWVRLLDSLHEGYWLGCLDHEDLTAITIRSFQQSRMYNGSEHNQSGLFPWERELIDRFFRSRSKILVAASGGGRELIALHGLGFQADGFECTPSLVETSSCRSSGLHQPWSSVPPMRFHRDWRCTTASWLDGEHTFISAAELAELHFFKSFAPWFHRAVLFLYRSGFERKRRWMKAELSDLRPAFDFCEAGGQIHWNSATM
jgi:hypothetical protein